MDGSTAAVIGALLGGGAAVAGQAIASRNARKQAEATERAVLGRERLRQARTVYEAFIAQVAMYRHACWIYRDWPAGDGERWLELSRQWAPLITAFTVTELEGPKPVSEAAMELQKYAGELDAAILKYHRGEDNGDEFTTFYESDKYNHLRASYALACRDALAKLAS
ncbi:hypothetical protein ACFVWP_33015 [Streptomyces sp. NPDC058175]|uniref:hypothetical protein n=1 Tax=Streptomyces sp. NPDC058175 TaxID=3346367 RepID=UPI0036E8F556